MHKEVATMARNLLFRGTQEARFKRLIIKLIQALAVDSVEGCKGSFVKRSCVVLSWLNRFVSIAFLWFLLAPGAYAALPLGFQEADIARPDGQMQWNGIVGVRFMDNGRAFAWERDGYVWIVDPANPVAAPFLDIHDEVNADHDHGMLGFALDPNFVDNGLFYVL